MKKYVQEGKVITLTATKNVVADNPDIIGDLRGVYVNSASIGEEVNFLIAGVVELPKEAVALANCPKVYITPAGAITNIPGADDVNKLYGVAVEDAVAQDATAKILIVQTL